MESYGFKGVPEVQIMLWATAWTLLEPECNTTGTLVYPSLAGLAGNNQWPRWPQWCRALHPHIFLHSKGYGALIGLGSQWEEVAILPRLKIFPLASTGWRSGKVATGTRLQSYSLHGYCQKMPWTPPEPLETEDPQHPRIHPNLWRGTRWQPPVDLMIPQGRGRNQLPNGGNLSPPVFGPRNPGFLLHQPIFQLLPPFSPFFGRCHFQNWISSCMDWTDHWLVPGTLWPLFGAWSGQELCVSPSPWHAFLAYLMLTPESWSTSHAGLLPFVSTYIYLLM